MTAPITIRPATSDDIPAIVTQRRRMFEDMGHTNPALLEAARIPFIQWLEERLANGRYLAWMAETSDSQVVAGAGLWLQDWPPGFFDIAPYRGYILNVYTNPEYRGQGLARQLVQEAVDWCAEQHIHVVSLHASDQGRSIYEKMGFIVTNEMRMILSE
jgi:GNAT superfamily N-acetyltransferase